MDHDGHPVNTSALQQGTNFTAVVTVSNSSPRGYNHLVLTEVFPAGWEILNTRFLTGDTVDNRVTITKIFVTIVLTAILTICLPESK